MSKPTYIAAIDIGTHSITGAIAEKLSNKTIKILGVEEVHTRPNAVVEGCVKDVNSVLFEIKTICKKLTNQTNIHINKLYLHSSGLTKESNYNEWEVLFANINGKRKESLSFISTPNLLTTKADLFLTPAEQNNGCLFIDMGAGSTSYILRLKGENDIKGFVNIGGYLISNDLTYKGLTLEYAEKLKKRLGNAQPNKLEFPNKYISLKPQGPFDINQSISLLDLSTMIEERVNDTARKILSKLIKTGKLSSPNCKIVLSGGACLLKNLPEWYADKTHLEVRIADAINIINNDELSQSCNKPKYHTLLSMLFLGSEDCRTEKRSSWKPFSRSTRDRINDTIDGVWGNIFE
jgi:cell division ATPase FtsA